jgi:GDP-mannose pyrophosphatase NudK
MKGTITNLKQAVLSKTWTTLSRVSFDYTLPNGETQQQVREVYDRGNGITALLFNRDKKTVLLTRQLRIPTYLNGNKDGLLIEACAGKLEDESSEEGMRREIEEELGHRVKEIRKVFEVYMSPGSVSEILHFYVAPYDDSTKVSPGGGLIEEHENIEVLEMTLDEACGSIKTGKIKDAKTIMLLQYAQLNMPL